MYDRLLIPSFIAALITIYGVDEIESENEHFSIVIEEQEYSIIFYTS